VADTVLPEGPRPRGRRSAGSRLAPAAVRALGRRLRHGKIQVTDDSGEHSFGSGSPTVKVTVHDPRAYGEMLRDGSVGLGRAYLAGWWDSDDLTLLFQLLGRNLAGVLGVADRVARALEPIRALRPHPRSVDKAGDRANVRAHYDLGNEFFELMLDETMFYSCAYFGDPSWSLARASEAKAELMCRRLDLRSSDHVVEIGSGWGGFAVHAASRYGCRVTTTTISDAQYEYTSKRVSDAGLAELVTVANRDYRDLKGAFDKLVSIEMIEAVGWQQLDTYFDTCADLLRDDGLMALQAIVIEDRSYERAKRHEDFIRQFIFPGGFLPSIEAIAGSVSRRGALRIVELEDIGRHYAETLRRWRGNLLRNAERVDSLGLGDTFSRMWHMYLCYCEAAFLERHVSDVQVLLARPAWRGSLARRSIA